MNSPRIKNKYLLTVRKVPYAARDEFRRLSRGAETYMEIKKGAPGDRVFYSVFLTPKELDRINLVLADPASNLLAVDPVLRATATATVPGASALAFCTMTGADGTEGLRGGGATVGVNDTGLDPGSISRMHQGMVKAYKCWTAYEDGSFATTAQPSDPEGHGTKMSSVARPPGAKLVVGASSPLNTDGLIAAMYWMVDDIGIDVLSMSWAIPDPYSPLQECVDHCFSKNVILNASRGNNSNSSYQAPGLCNHVQAISAYDSRNGNPASYTSFGDVWAASVGEGIYMDAAASDGGGITDGNNGGTSSACALASNIMTRLIGYGHSPGNIVDYLAKTARRTTHSGAVQGHGVMQLHAANKKITEDRPNKKNLDGSEYQGKEAGPGSYGPAPRDGCAK